MQYLHFVVRDNMNALKWQAVVFLQPAGDERNLPLDQQAILQANYVAPDPASAITWANKEGFAKTNIMPTYTQQTLTCTWRQENNGAFMPHYT